jgi:hypothetical protein
MVRCGAKCEPSERIPQLNVYLHQHVPSGPAIRGARDPRPIGAVGSDHRNSRNHRSVRTACPGSAALVSRRLGEVQAASDFFRCSAACGLAGNADGIATTCSRTVRCRGVKGSGQRCNGGKYGCAEWLVGSYFPASHSQGFRISTPVGSKSWTLRVTTVMP